MNILKCCRLRSILIASVRCLVACLTLILLITPVLATATPKERLVVLPFEIIDNTPIPGSIDRNEKMLAKLTQFVAQEISDKGLFNVVSQNSVNATVNEAQLGSYIHTCNQCEYDLAKKLEGEKVMIGWVYKMSILILTMHIEVKDVASEKTLISKAYDFRGDNEKAWLRAGKYMVQDLAVRLKKL